jgi:ubiquinone/menaquinone biosynthesis C-methylase UbiE
MTQAAIERYTLGYGETALAFVGRRTLESHGAFFIPHLQPGMQVLDCGCGPGSMTMGIAVRVGRGSVIGVDLDASQIQIAEQRAAQETHANASFHQASVYELPFDDERFDAVFSHALFEHLADPERAARECLRVLKPGGIIGIATPDWGGFIIAPQSPEMTEAIRVYEENQNRNGGNTRIGRELARIVSRAGFQHASLHARYENYAPLTVISDLMVSQFERDGFPQHAATLRRWQADPSGLFAQAWVSCMARKKN